VVALQPKPDSDEDRPITLTGSGLYRTWSRIRKPYMVEYDTNKAGFWDAAVRGNHCLQVALCRALKIDIAKCMDLHMAVFLFDLAKFFDSVRLSHLITACIDRDFPAIIMLMALKVHRAARIIQAVTNAGVCMSEPTMPHHNSIVAGCIWAVTFTRMHLYALLEHIHVQSLFPVAALTTWIDDMLMVVQGKCENTTAANAVGAASLFMEGAIAQGLAISKKSACLTSSRQLRDSMKAKLKKRYWPIKFKSSGKYLGTDIVMGGKRLNKTQAKRAKKAKGRSAKVKGLMRAHKRGARKLIMTGVIPQATWGHQALGMAPTAIRQLKTRVGVDSHMWYSGGCMTSCLALEIGHRADPEYAIPMQLFQSYLSLMPELQRHSMALEKIWRQKYHKLKGLHRWQVVTSTMDAIIATLFDMGWKPHWPWKWIDDQGNWWTMDVHSAQLIPQLLAVIDDSLIRRLHAKMAKHYCGQGSARGTDMTIIQQYIHRKAKASPQDAGRARAIGQGAIWDYARQAMAKRPQCKQKCQYCVCPVANWQHQVYECPHSLRSTDPDIQNTNYLCSEACKDDAEHCFYLRGLVPSQWIHTETPSGNPGVVKGGGIHTDWAGYIWVPPELVVRTGAWQH
jgi:hypothetical protein